MKLPITTKIYSPMQEDNLLPWKKYFSSKMPVLRIKECLPVAETGIRACYRDNELQ